MRWAPKVYHIDVCTIISDRDFIMSLRSAFDFARQKILGLQLRRVKAIRFVEVRSPVAHTYVDCAQY